MKNAAYVLLAMVFLSSCDKETIFDYYLDNQSSTAVTVSGSNIIQSADIEKTINPSEKEELASWSKRGKQTDYFEPTALFGDDLLIISDAGDTLNKDYTVLSNWTSNVNDNRAVAIHTYVLVVTDADF